MVRVVAPTTCGFVGYAAIVQPRAAEILQAVFCGTFFRLPSVAFTRCRGSAACVGDAFAFVARGWRQTQRQWLPLLLRRWPARLGDCARRAPAQPIQHGVWQFLRRIQLQRFSRLLCGLFLSWSRRRGRPTRQGDPFVGTTGARPTLASILPRRLFGM